MEKNNALLRDRPIKVINKRTNLPAWQVSLVRRHHCTWLHLHALLCVSLICAAVNRYRGRQGASERGRVI